MNHLLFVSLSEYYRKVPSTLYKNPKEWNRPWTVSAVKAGFRLDMCAGVRVTSAANISQELRMAQDFHESMLATYFKISPLMIFPETLGNFRVFLKQGETHVLYADARKGFSERHRRNLHENGIQDVYVLTEERESYDDYVETNLGRILGDDSIPVESRSQVFYSASSTIVHEVFDKRLPEGLSAKQFNRVAALIKASVRLLTMDEALKAVSAFISHDYKTYDHCVHVFVYTMTILNSYGLSRDELFKNGLGAMLHDLGKARIPKAVLGKRDKLTPQEFELIKTHPSQGVSMCAGVPQIAGPALNNILFHHERMDGKGYPTGLKGEEIPLGVKALSLADAYDALTSDRAYAQAKTPFEALKEMRANRGAYDMAVYKRFVQLLSDAELV